MSDHPYQYGPQQGNQPSAPGGFGGANPPNLGDYGTNAPGQGGPPGGSTYGNPSGGATYGSPAGPGSPYDAASPYGNQPGYGTPPTSGGYGAPPTSGGYGSPPPGPGGYGPGVPEPKSGTNGFAIAGLISGLVAPCGGGLLSVIFGAVALNQIKKTGQKGRGLAIGGFIATGAWILILGIAVALAIILGAAAEDNTGDSPDRDTGGITGSDSTDNDLDGDTGSDLGDDTGSSSGDDTGDEVDVYSLQVGDCLTDLSGTQFSSLPVVPCTQPHEGEVYALFDIDGNLYPGSDSVIEDAQQGCYDRLRSYSSSAFNDNDVDIFYLYPTEATWALGDREVVCVTYYLDGPRTGSIAD